MTLFFDALFAGAAIGSIYAVVGIGFAVVYRATGVFNLAQGDFVMLAIMSSYFVLDVLKWGQFADVVLVLPFIVLVSLFEERFVVRRFLTHRGGPTFGWFIATLGFSLIIETIVNAAFGDHQIVGIPSPLPLGGIDLGSVVIGHQQLLLICVFCVLILLIAIFYDRTWLGQAMTATAEDREAAGLTGINPAAMSRAAFALAGLVAGIAGYLVAPITFSDPTVGLQFTLYGFLALAIGGFGSIRGAIAGGILLGIAEQLWDLHFGSDFQVVADVLIVLLVLVIRPAGLFKVSALRTV
jgi:branched-chain amino acid transport system permease protein